MGLFKNNNKQQARRNKKKKSACREGATNGPSSDGCKWNDPAQQPPPSDVTEGQSGENPETGIKEDIPTSDVTPAQGDPGESETETLGNNQKQNNPPKDVGDTLQTDLRENETETTGNNQASHDDEAQTKIDYRCKDTDKKESGYMKDDSEQPPKEKESESIHTSGIHNESAGVDSHDLQKATADSDPNSGQQHKTNQLESQQQQLQQQRTQEQQQQRTDQDQTQQHQAQQHQTQQHQTQQHQPEGDSEKQMGRPGDKYDDGDWDEHGGEYVPFDWFDASEEDQSTIHIQSASGHLKQSTEPPQGGDEHPGELAADDTELDANSNSSQTGPGQNLLEEQNEQPQQQKEHQQEHQAQQYQEDNITQGRHPYQQKLQQPNRHGYQHGNQQDSRQKQPQHESEREDGYHGRRKRNKRGRGKHASDRDSHDNEPLSDKRGARRDAQRVEGSGGRGNPKGQGRGDIANQKGQGRGDIANQKGQGRNGIDHQQGQGRGDIDGQKGESRGNNEDHGGVERVNVTIVFKGLNRHEGRANDDLDDTKASQGHGNRYGPKRREGRAKNNLDETQLNTDSGDRLHGDRFYHASKRGASGGYNNDFKRDADRGKKRFNERGAGRDNRGPRESGRGNHQRHCDHSNQRASHDRQYEDYDSRTAGNNVREEVRPDKHSRNDYPQNNESSDQNSASGHNDDNVQGNTQHFDNHSETGDAQDFPEQSQETDPTFESDFPTLSRETQKQSKGAWTSGNAQHGFMFNAGSEQDNWRQSCGQWGQNSQRSNRARNEPWKPGSVGGRRSKGEGRWSHDENGSQEGQGHFDNSRRPYDKDKRGSKGASRFSFRAGKEKGSYYSKNRPTGKRYSHSEEAMMGTVNENEQRVKQQCERSDDHVFAFFGRDSPLSNFHPAKLWLAYDAINDENWNCTDGWYFNCVEQGYQFLKAKYYERDDIADKIKSLHVPAKMKGAAYFDHDNSWKDSGEALRIMERLVRAKFKQNAPLGKALLMTGSRLIAEASPKDYYWGTGVAMYLPNGLDPQTFQGENHLGKIVQKVREELKNSKQ